MNLEFLSRIRSPLQFPGRVARREIGKSIDGKDELDVVSQQENQNSESIPKLKFQNSHYIDLTRENYTRATTMIS